jgi:hypothetical protein
MTTPTITQYPDTLPAKGQANAAFDTNVDNFLTWQTVTNGPELAAMITWTQGVADTVLATALAGDLPALTGKALNFIRANAAENGGEFRTPAQVLSDIGAASTDSVALKAPIASPTFTGAPAVPTATVGTNTTQAASTAFVLANAPAAVVEIISTTVISTAVSSIDLTGFDAALYTSYEVELMNLTPVSDNVSLYLRTSSNGGVSWDSGASDYVWSYGGFYAGTTAYSGSFGSAFGHIAVGVGSASGEQGASGLLRISGPHLARKTVINSQLNYPFGNNATYNMSSGVIRQSAADVDGVQVYFSAGNVESGTVVFRGIK